MVLGSSHLAKNADYQTIGSKSIGSTDHTVNFTGSWTTWS